ncbi:class I SAM-dependent methyltransferase [Leptospira vanthielii]|uniref:Class I SAM-dependent methyltransferase n=1 Tax=Leptospira vanthielii TaxID=293085 RepID=A0ABY2NSW0_9LEPT|nr:class I SAM-dependent methyltransferase [Leptospira vanthielii]TGM60673.1 class I SAM-dependent methyltransferase [Leptospira vanthielii]
MRDVENWLTEQELENIYSADYWNDIEEEKSKEFWILDGNYKKCLDYLKNSKLLDEYYASEKYVNEKSGDGKLLDLAAGIGWTSSLLSKLGSIKEVHAVEISKHRIGELFEHAVKMMVGSPEKIFRYIGSFYKLKFPNEVFDVIFMSQAFHHSDKPLHLLFECDRVLKKGGRIILIGEQNITARLMFRRFVGNLLRTKKIVFNFYELFLPDSRLGDHYYRMSDYFFMFQSMGYKLKYEVAPTGNIMYIADKE